MGASVLSGRKLKHSKVSMREREREREREKKGERSEVYPIINI